MGRNFARLVELAIASGALVIPGYAAAGDAPAAAQRPAASAPRAPAPLVRSAKIDKGGLTIQFSEPVRVASDVDPNKFRLTFAYYSKSRPGTYSYYYEYYGANRAF